MIEIIVDDQPLFIAKGTTLQMEVNNTAFSTQKIEGDIVFTFDIPAEKNDLIFRHARFVYVQRQKKFECRVLAGGIEIASGDLFLQKTNLVNYSCGLVINPFPIDFADNKLCKNNYGEDIVISRNNNSHKQNWKNFLQMSLNENSVYKFPLFIDTAFYGSANEDFGWYLLPTDNSTQNNPSGFQASLNTNDNIGLDRCYINRLFTDTNGNVIEVFSNSNRGIRLFNNQEIDNPNSFAFCPALKLLFVLDKTVQTGGYNLMGNFQEEPAVKQLLIQSMRALDGLATQYDDIAAGVKVCINSDVSYIDQTDEQLILSFHDEDNQTHLYLTPSVSRTFQMEVSVNTYLPANILSSGFVDDTTDEYKEAIIFMLIERNQDFPNWLYGSFNEDWNDGIGYMENGDYTSFDDYYKIYTPDKLQEFGYQGAGFYSLIFNFNQYLSANKAYHLFFGKVRGYSSANIFYITMLDEYANIPITQDVTSFYNLYNCFANKLKFSEHVPSLTNSDFLSTICNGFGLAIFIDSSKKQMEFTFFKDILHSSKSLDLSEFVLNKETYIEKYEPKQYQYKLQGLTTESIDETKLLPAVRTMTDLPDALANYGKICFVMNENCYRIAEREGDAQANWVFKWNPYSGNNLNLVIGDGNKEEIIPTAKVPIMKIADEKVYNKLFILQIESEGCSPIFNTGNTEFELMLISYYGRKQLNTNAETVWYEAARPMSYDKNGNEEPGIDLSAIGANSLGELWIKPWLQFLSSYEKVNYKMILTLSKFLEVWQLLKPQDTSVESQTRWVLIDNVKMLPVRMTFQFTEGSERIVAELELAKGKVDI